jgi:hypothetical protein
MPVIRCSSGDHRRIASLCKALLAGHSMLLWSMAVLIPFRSKSEPSQSPFVRVIEWLTCPACEYEAYSTADLHTHVQHKHAPTYGRSKTLHLVLRPRIVKDLR